MAGRGRGPLIHHPSQDFIAWCTRWGFTPSSAVFGWALRTLAQWRVNPTLKQGLQWKTTIWGVSTFTEAIHDEYPSTDALRARDPLIPIEAFPELETEEEFVNRSAQHWQARVNALRATATPSDPPLLRWFEFLARNQVFRHAFDPSSRQTITEIRKQFGVKHDTVAAGIKRAAAVLGMKVNRRGGVAHQSPGNTRFDFLRFGDIQSCPVYSAVNTQFKVVRHPGIFFSPTTTHNESSCEESVHLVRC